ncbi:GPP34 family phosphoprotein [Mycobacterium sp. TNTM28]|uniref:GPP34 family phosphoprotein n=1 Tax=[Mycobacterium] fortunisiensis TaxID=2600579 RepID=A0ABS6KRZ4_9MYCO|nr:GPP34 family phosphoprotein [[Mycobacterium] fortunisiensis]MBU9766417.1 GPP34 family phosphoprotein [[Mycobacterium] fortunisiensis]
MAQIAEDLFLLLLDNAAAQPGLDRRRREKVLSAAVLLDLAYACRIRPAMAGEPIEAGHLVALAGGWPVDEVGSAALELLQRRPLQAETALAKLSRRVQSDLETHLERIGQIRRVRMPGKGFPGRTVYCWPLTDRERVSQARAALLAALFDGHTPVPAIAAIICLLHAVDGLGAVLSLNDRGWRWVHARATEIATGGWVDETASALPEMNLAVTTSALRLALMA